MYMCLLFGTTFILSIILSSWAAGPDFTSPFDDSQQTDLSNPPFINLGSDSTPPLFDADITPSPEEAFPDSSLPFPADPPESDLSADLSWDDDGSFHLADCSSLENENPLLPALGKSRVRRTEDDDGSPSPSCMNSNADGVPETNPPSSGPTFVFLQPQAFDSEKHSITCWEYSRGTLPFAVASTGEPYDVRKVSSKVFGLPTPIFQRTSLFAVYRATVLTGAVWEGDLRIFCCQYVREFFTYAMGINCVRLWALV